MTKRPTPNRVADTSRFYHLLAGIEGRIGGRPVLAACDGRMDWPQRGVYFFFEAGEQRSFSGAGDRVVRVGTHAVTDKSRTTLWARLSQHRGSAKSGGGNHRGSIFRLLVGRALECATRRSGARSQGDTAALSRACGLAACGAILGRLKADDSPAGKAPGWKTPYR